MKYSVYNAVIQLIQFRVVKRFYSWSKDHHFNFKLLVSYRNCALEVIQSSEWRDDISKESKTFTVMVFYTRIKIKQCNNSSISYSRHVTFPPLGFKEVNCMEDMIASKYWQNTNLDSQIFQFSLIRVLIYICFTLCIFEFLLF